jgi:hypothetical protein
VRSAGLCPRKRSRRTRFSRVERDARTGIQCSVHGAWELIRPRRSLTSSSEATRPRASVRRRGVGKHKPCSRALEPGAAGRGARRTASLRGAGPPTQLLSQRGDAAAVRSAGQRSTARCSLTSSPLRCRVPRHTTRQARSAPRSRARPGSERLRVLARATWRCEQLVTVSGVRASVSVPWLPARRSTA